MVDVAIGPTYPQGVRSYVATHTGTCDLLALCVSLPEGSNLHPPPVPFDAWLDWLMSDDVPQQTSLIQHLENWEERLAEPTIDRLWQVRSEALAAAAFMPQQMIWFRDSSDDPEVPAGCRQAAREAWLQSSAMYTEMRDLAGWCAAAVNHLRRAGG